MADVRLGDEGDWYLRDGDTAIVYMCAVDWEHHTLADPAGANVYPSEEILRDARPCVSECGIVEIEMKVRRWVQKQDFKAAVDNTQKGETKC